MLHDEKVIDQIQTANDIVDVISQYIPLKRAGRNFKARCPFHEEKTPSFMVSAEKQIFHCFGCGAGGNVFGFVMKHENLSFPEALRHLAERAHISLPEKSEGRAKTASETEPILEIYRLAGEYYHRIFVEQERGKEARKYFLARGFDMELAREFKIGWAPDEWRGLFTFLSQKGFSQDLLLKSRLIYPSQQGHPYDIFRARLLFPIHNLQGRVVAFGGRLIGPGDGPKYLNSPENPIFRKRRELFGLHVAKKEVNRELPRLYVVEGYFDFLRLYQRGYRASVATLGTALTDDHVALLKRFADEAVVVYDGDKAGETAALRGLEVFLEGGMSVKLIRMPEGYDPDEFLWKKDVENFQVLINEARDFFDYKLEILLGRYNASESLGLMKITNDFLETLGKVRSPILLDRYLRRLSSSLGVDEHSLREELSKLRGKTHERDRKAGVQPEKSPVPPRPGADTFQDEVLVAAFLLDESEWRADGFSRILPADFEQASLRELFERIASAHAEKTEFGWAHAMNCIKDQSLRDRMTAAAALDWQPEEKLKAFDDCVRSLLKKRVQKRLDELRREIWKAEKKGQQELLLGFTREYQMLLQQFR